MAQRIVVPLLGAVSHDTIKILKKERNWNMHPSFRCELVPTTEAVRKAKTKLINYIRHSQQFISFIQDINMRPTSSMERVVWPLNRGTRVALETYDDVLVRYNNERDRLIKLVTKGTVRPITDQDIIEHELNWSSLLDTLYMELAGIDIRYGYARIKREYDNGIWQLVLNWIAQ